MTSPTDPPASSSSSSVHPKVAAAGVGGAAATVVLWVLSLWVTPPAPVDAAIATLVAFVAGWFTDG